MFKNIPIEIRLEELGYQPKKAPDYITIKCHNQKRFTKTEVDTLMDLATMYDIKQFSVHKDYAKFYDEEEEQ